MAGVANIVGRAVVAGVAGSAVMTAFQKFIEMPLTGREDSDAPAQLAQKVLPVEPKNEKEKTRLNQITHYALGAMWGAAYGVAAYKGLRGPKAVARVFPAIYTNDIITITSLGLAKPWNWTRKETAIDVVDKFVQVMATSFIFDRFLDPKRR
ncbi:MAG TPA: hypothetical protein VK983_02395 [Candidatus Limnocylindrales bacterium]|nr:hypothetical protein [Candidatus Limnocylindrales bacterium]